MRKLCALQTETRTASGPFAWLTWSRHSLIVDPNNPALYTNRAMARLKLSQWDDAIADCNECLKLSPDSMKAHYSLSQAHLALHAYDDALEHALKAHKLCAQSMDKSLATITAHVLKCKKERWDDMEKRRLRETSGLQVEVLELLQRERDQAIRDAADLDEGSRKEIEAEWDQKIEQMRDVFERARSGKEKRRKVPDWAIDDITFEVMVDPVIVGFDALLLKTSTCSAQPR
jgi:STIP1 family protein 1